MEYIVNFSKISNKEYEVSGTSRYGAVKAAAELDGNEYPITYYYAVATVIKKNPKHPPGWEKFKPRKLTKVGKVGKSSVGS